MADIIVRNISATPLVVRTHLDGVVEDHSIASGATHVFDARVLDQVLEQGWKAPHGQVSVLDETRNTGCKFAIISVSEPS